MLKRFQRWWVRHFGSFEQQKTAVYQELMEQGVGAKRRGFYLRDETDARQVLNYLNQQIALAKAPYGATVLMLKAYPLDESLKKGMSGVELTKVLEPFGKDEWPALREQALRNLQEVAACSPANAVGVIVFNFGEVLVQAADQLDATLTRSTTPH